MNLVIVESPTKARKLKGYLGPDFHVEASVGHVRDLSKKKLSVDVDNNFEPTYEVSDDKKKVVNQLRRLASSSDLVYLAMDPDREGEAIAWHIQELLTEEKNKAERAIPKEEKLKRFRRSTFNQITKPAVLEAIENPSKLDMNMVDAQQARRVVDRLVGYQVSPVLWKKIRRGLSAGRVQSVALRLVSEREREIEAFKPEEFWEVEVGLFTDPSMAGSSPKISLFKDGKPLEEFPASVADSVLLVKLDKVNGKKLTRDSKSPLNSKDSATPVIAGLEKAKYNVLNVEKKERKRQSLPPFITSTLQQGSATKFGYSAKQTMMFAQQLYEEGLITYHRTDSFNLAGSAVEMARAFITKQFGTEYLPEKPRLFSKKSKNAQEAHEAIRVTDLSVTIDNIASRGAKLTEKHAKVYDLIWRRFVASQMSAAKYDQTTIIVEGKGTGDASSEEYTLRTTGSIMRFAGWTKLFTTGDDKFLPELQANDELGYGDINPMQKFTQPPARYNDASLIKELEKRGIGRPSTYASIISVIVQRGYVERQEKKFFTTVIGLTVNDFLLKHFQEFMDYDFTAEMEEDLDRISRGEKEWRKVVGTFYSPLAKKIENVTENAERSQIPVEKTGVTCPDCIKSNKAGELAKEEIGEVVIRSGRFGKFKSCSRYPDCKFTENIVHKLGDQKCPLCQKGDVIMRNTRWGKMFYGCESYPKCDWASWSKPDPELRVGKEEWAEMQKRRKEKNEKRKATIAAKKAAADKKAGKKPKKKAASKKKTTKKKPKKTAAKKKTAKK